jgi:hypothetical protein
MNKMLFAMIALAAFGAIGTMVYKANGPKKSVSEASAVSNDVAKEGCCGGCCSEAKTEMVAAEAKSCCDSGEAMVAKKEGCCGSCAESAVAKVATPSCCSKDAEVMVSAPGETKSCCSSSAETTVSTEAKSDEAANCEGKCETDCCQEKGETVAKTDGKQGE